MLIKPAWPVTLGSCACELAAAVASSNRKLRTRRPREGGGPIFNLHGFPPPRERPCNTLPQWCDVVGLSSSCAAMITITAATIAPRRSHWCTSCAAPPTPPKPASDPPYGALTDALARALSWLDALAGRAFAATGAGIELPLAMREVLPAFSGVVP